MSSFLHALFVGVSFFLAVISAQAGDRSPSPVSTDISPYPKRLVAKVQKDDFSCGFLALAAVYESYGLNPTDYRLRERLGTNVPAIPFVQSSNGTLQPDLFRVLKQDGFDATPLNPSDSESLKKLSSHLGNSQYALALIQTNQVGGLHWIVLTDYDFRSDEVTIADSLVAELQQKSLSAMAEEKLLRVILLEPTLADPNGGYWLAQALGLSEMGLSLPPLLLFALFIILVGFVAVLFFVAKRILFRFRRISPS